MSDAAPGGETMTPELMPCPFCGGKAALEFDDGWDVYCPMTWNPMCGVWPRAMHMSKDEAVAQWNRRSSTPTRAATDAPQPLMMTDNGFPRRNRTDLWTEAEAAIQRAVDVCERTIPADPLETDAIILLGDARNKIGELVDREIAAGRMLMPSRPAGGPNVMCPQCGCDVIEGLREDVRSGVADKDEVGLLAALESLSSSPSSTTATRCTGTASNGQRCEREDEHGGLCDAANWPALPSSRAGNGSLSLHVASNVLALYPGGPLRGHYVQPVLPPEPPSE